MTFYFKFRVSDDLFFGLLKSSKKKQHLICYKRDHTKAKLTVTVNLDSPNGKGAV